MHDVIMATLSSTILLYNPWSLSCSLVEEENHSREFSCQGRKVQRVRIVEADCRVYQPRDAHGTCATPNGQQRAGWMKVCLESARSPMHLHKTGQKHTEKPYLLSSPEFEMENGANW